MKLSEQAKTKLDLIRIEGLCKLIFNKIDEETIISKISNVTKSNPRDAKALTKLSRSQLISIIEKSSINDEEINQCYEEFRYGLKPGFSIFSFKSNKKLTLSQVSNNLKEKLKINTSENEEQLAIKNIKYVTLENFSKQNLTEYTFSFLKKHSYIDENEEPKYIYELKETFIWISTKYNFVAIRNCDDRVIKQLSSVISDIYDTELNSIYLTNELVKKIFGEKRKKVAGINLQANDKEAQKIIMSAPNLNEKEDLQRQLESYTMTSENLEINIEDITNTLGINNVKGKLYLTKNMTATVFRNWSIETIRKIIEYISNNETEFEIFKAKNIMNNKRWNEYNEEQKNIIEEIIFKIICFSKNKKVYNPIITSNVNYSKLYKYFYSKVFVSCSECNDAFCIPKCNCGSYNLNLTNQGKIICVDCGNIMNTLECEEGHEINISNLDNTNIYFIPKMELYNNIISYLKEEVNIDFSGYMYIINNNLQIVEKSKGELLKVNEIKEFKEICDLNIQKEEQTQLQKRLKKINEKCNESNKEKCNICDNESENKCILKLFTTYSGYRPSPHHGHEFGDINFKVNYKNNQCEFVGIAKSYCNLTHASKEGREMIQQILSSTQDKRIDIIGAICPSRFDDQLEKDIEYIAKCTQTKIVIIDDLFMVKQLKKYESMQK